MKMRELKQMAKRVGVEVVPEIGKESIIKSIQKAEGKFDCFGTAVSYCDQEKCCFREDCLK